MLGTGFQNFGFKDIEIINNSRGRPEVNLYGKAQKLAEKKELETIHISISHEKKYAIAEAIGEKGGFFSDCSNTGSDASNG